MQKREKEGEEHEEGEGEILSEHWKDSMDSGREVVWRSSGRERAGNQTFWDQPRELQLYLISDTKVIRGSEQSFDMSTVVS